MSCGLKKGVILHRVTVTKSGPVTHRLTLAKKFFEKHQEIPALLLEGEVPIQIKAFQRLMKKLFHILRVNVDMYRCNLLQVHCLLPQILPPY